MNKLSIKLCCPKCGFPVNASIEENNPECLLFICPKCQSNVVYYNNKLDIISDNMMRKLFKKNKLKMCGMMEIEPSPGPKDTPITSDDIINLRILLETTDSVEDFIEKLKLL